MDDGETDVDKLSLVFRLYSELGIKIGEEIIDGKMKIWCSRCGVYLKELELGDIISEVPATIEQIMLKIRGILCLDCTSQHQIETAPLKPLATW